MNTYKSLSELTPVALHLAQALASSFPKASVSTDTSLPATVTFSLPNLHITLHITPTCDNLFYFLPLRIFRRSPADVIQTLAQIARNPKPFYTEAAILRRIASTHSPYPSHT